MTTLRGAIKFKNIFKIKFVSVGMHPEPNVFSNKPTNGVGLVRVMNKCEPQDLHISHLEKVNLVQKRESKNQRCPQLNQMSN